MAFCYPITSLEIGSYAEKYQFTQMRPLLWPYRQRRKTSTHIKTRRQPWSTGSKINHILPTASMEMAQQTIRSGTCVNDWIDWRCSRALRFFGMPSWLNRSPCQYHPQECWIVTSGLVSCRLLHRIEDLASLLALYIFPLIFRHNYLAIFCVFLDMRSSCAPTD